MRELFTILMAAALFGCATAAPAPQPDVNPTSLEPYQIFRTAEFSIAAPDATACASRQASKRNLAQNFVIGDADSITRQFPGVAFSNPEEQPLFVVMSLLNSDDTLPQWLVTAQDLGNKHSIVELKNGGEPTKNLAKFSQIWAAIASCDTPSP